MAFDYKKEYREYYMPKNKPLLVMVPPMNFIAVRGKGDPNEESGSYKQAIGSYDDEPATIEAMDAFAIAEGHVLIFL